MLFDSVKVRKSLLVSVSCILLSSTDLISAIEKRSNTSNLLQSRLLARERSTVRPNPADGRIHGKARIISTVNSISSTEATPNHEGNSSETYETFTLPIRTRSQHDGYSEPDDYRVPFWNIAHMINSIDQIEQVLRDGANGIETDISFDQTSGIPVECYHGFPCDCGRHCHHKEDFIKFIRHLGDLSTSNVELRPGLVLLDLKLKELSDAAKENAGRYLASVLNENLYRRHLNIFRPGRRSLDPPPTRVIVSINHVTDRILVQSFVNYMRQNQLDWMAQHVGFDVGMNDNLSDIGQMWNGLEAGTFNIWQGDGLTNCANLVRGLDRLKEAISVRNGQGHFRKIYYWTADVMYQIRSVLRLGLDALLTNQPQRVVQVLQEVEFRNKYRLATLYDDPFAQFWIQPSAWKMSPPTLGETIETVSNIQKTSANFIKSLPDGISAIIKKVQQTISQ